MLGNEVMIIASTQSYLNNGEIGYVDPCDYYNKDGIRVVRLPYLMGPVRLFCKIRAYRGLRNLISEFQPDLIFLHDIQFVDLLKVVRYKRLHPSVRVIADGHSDDINSAHGFFSRFVLHRFFYRLIIRAAIPYIEMFYGTLPCRCTFMKDMYGIPDEKISYLPFGADDTLRKRVFEENLWGTIRTRLGIDENDYVLVTGGKYNSRKKEVFLLMKAVSTIDLPVKLLMFGGATCDIIDELQEYSKLSNVIFAGWADVQASYEYMSVADAAIFPGLHSTLWEQAAGMGLPCVIRSIEGYTYLNRDDNCVFITRLTETDIIKAIHSLYNNRDKYKKNAERVREQFSYMEIAASVL